MSDANTTGLEIVEYAIQASAWPPEGRAILAPYDATEIEVYQAFHPVTAEYAVTHQRLGGPRYSFTGMSWLKPNFLWMMYRCGWLEKKEAQSRVLAIKILRSFLDELLEAAVPSSWSEGLYATRAEWRSAIQDSDVRLQRNPDHHPAGTPVRRRAIQLGLRGSKLRRFVDEETRSIEDISGFIRHEREQRADPTRLRCPRERHYEVRSANARVCLGLQRLQP